MCIWERMSPMGLSIKVQKLFRFCFRFSDAVIRFKTKQKTQGMKIQFRYWINLETVVCYVFILYG